MKKLKILSVLLVFTLALAPAWAQPASETSRPAINPPGQPSSPPKLTKFDLDFPGGSPQDLIAAIGKATGKPLNVIIDQEQAASIIIPRLKMSNIDVAELFQALRNISNKEEFTFSSNGSYSRYISSYRFETINGANEDAIWFFLVNKPASPPFHSACRFYSLAPYLEQGLTVDDITTAVQTGWKMLAATTVGSGDLPQINYHKETKLLIAVGDPARLETIDAVLKALEVKTPKFQNTLRDMMKRAETDPATNSPAEKAKP